MYRLIARLHGIGNDDGMTTVEYAVGTVAAAAFAFVLLKVLESPAVQEQLTRIITEALN